MCLSLTLLTVPSDPNEWVVLLVSFRAIDNDGPGGSSFDNLNEIVQSWCYAQELDTIEHAFMNVVTTFCGRVRRPFLLGYDDTPSNHDKGISGRKYRPRRRRESPTLDI